MATNKTPPKTHDAYDPIRKAIKAEEKEVARAMLRPILNSQPTAEAWFLAALAAETREQSINFLRRALAIEPQHSGANRLLLKLEGPKPSIANMPSLIPVDVPTGLNERKARRVAADKEKGKGRGFPWLGCLVVVLFVVVVLAVALNALGVYQGLITGITQVSGGPTPVLEVNGTPLADVDNAAAIVPPSQSKNAIARDADILENGYSHEYVFTGSIGEQVAISVQFLSIAAEHVSRNVAILGPDGVDLTSTCAHAASSQTDNNIALTCTIVTSGAYRVRVLGRTGESVGAYFVGVTKILQ